MCKKNVKMDLYYVKICKHDHEKTCQGYGVKLCLKLVLNILKEMRGPTFLGT
jgi:hypothetical protein